MISGMQTTSPLQPVKNYREDEEEKENTPETQEINKHVETLNRDPNIANLALKFDCVGQKGADGKDSRVWYLFSKQTENTPTGPAAKKYGGFATNELKKMSQELQAIGSKGISSYFNGQPPK